MISDGNEMHGQTKNNVVELQLAISPLMIQGGIVNSGAKVEHLKLM